ncbi:MAG: helix-turn-helix transcriptional regulator [Paracoccus sp. (in: a-proteobacteria)]|uniref:helix-turn-helix transcriptional regulator n=1 Tax=Paracoccus sp. TaxID=267 RepID=UPI00391B8802
MWHPRNDPSAHPETRRITIRDLAGRTGPQQLDVQTEGDEEQDLMQGHFVQQDLGGGLSLHGGDVLECQAFDVRSGIDEGLSCIFFLDGRIETMIGDRSFHFQGTRQHPVSALMLMNTGPESFHRRSPARQRVTHLVVHASPDWLAHHGCDTVADHSSANRILSDNLAGHRWTVSSSVKTMIHSLLDLPSRVAPLERLHAEACAIQIIAESLGQATQSCAVPAHKTGTAARGRNILARAKEFIAGHNTDDLTVEAIARAAGISVSGLHALFRQYEHCGVLEYVRNLRLDQAYDALLTGQSTISEAAHAAGYRHPANFATAFKRRFSVPPICIARVARD